MSTFLINGQEGDPVYEIERDIESMTRQIDKLQGLVHTSIPNKNLHKIVEAYMRSIERETGHGTW